MTTTPPGKSIQGFVCPHCKQSSSIESGGSYPRRVRDLSGIRDEKVKRYRCSQCLRALASEYPQGVQRYKWYSQLFQKLFSILAIHQVAQACIHEIASLLAFPVVEDTQNAWQDTRAHRAETLHQKALKVVQDRKTTIQCASLDEIKIGQEWGYTLSDTYSCAVVVYSISPQRDEMAVRDLLALYPPKALISDGCKAIQAGSEWFGDIPKGRCWFHLMQDVARLAPTGQDKVSGLSHKQLLLIRLQTLYRSENLSVAETYLRLLQNDYSAQLLQPLLDAWSQLKLYWIIPQMPGTNNTSEHLYSALWARERKRVVKASHRAMAWFSEAIFRWNHHPIRGLSPWQRFSAPSSPCWLSRLNTPLRYPFPGSTDF